MKPLPAIAVLLFGFAGTMVLLRTGADGDHPTSPTRTMSHERGAEPRRTEIARHLFDPALDRSERASLIHNLSDEDLRRLTMNLVRSVAAHGGESETRDDIRLLTLLVMESGRRDIDGLLVAIEAVPAQPPFGNEDLKARITYAALAGMAEKNPAGAWIQLTKLNADQFLREEDSATEAIFRSWVREDPNAAWSVIETGQIKRIENAVLGALSEATAPEHRDRLLDHVSNLLSNKVRSAEPITRNNIDSVLKKPYGFGAESLVVATALGLAETDSEAAWTWLSSPIPDARSKHASDGTITGLGYGVSSRLLKCWAERQPDEAIRFFELHLSRLSRHDWHGLMDGLYCRDPSAAIEQLRKTGDSDLRLMLFTRWFQQSHDATDQQWPILPFQQQIMSMDEIVDTISREIGRLGLDSDREKKALELIRSSRQSLQSETD